MKKLASFALSLLVLGSLQPLEARATEVPLPLKCLWSSYRNFRISADASKIAFADGTVLPYDNGDREPDWRDPHNPVATNIAQMFAMAYPFGFMIDRAGRRVYDIPNSQNEDPGRIRFEPLFKKLYGDSEAAVEKDLVTVTWAVDGTKLKFNRRYGAATALTKIGEGLAQLARRDRTLAKFISSPLGGTFAWRKIAGSPNLSVHSFAVAIDINTDQTDYWSWDLRRDGELRYHNRIPPEIAEVFENNGFIWGGKWMHYDTMHFEFRPELMMSPEQCEAGFAQYPLVSR